MSNIAYTVYPSEYYQAEEAREMVKRIDEFSYNCLFTDAYWCHVTFVAVAHDRETLGIIGLATLAPWDSNGEGAPKIIGVYVRSEYRQQGIATQLDALLCERSFLEYGTWPCCVATTRHGLLLAKSVQRRYSLAVRDLSSFKAFSRRLCE